MTSLSNDIKAHKMQMNLQVLQKSIDDTITKIEHTFDHAVLYEYHAKKQEWKKKQVEGTCFIVRKSDDSVILVIMNRYDFFSSLFLFLKIHESAFEK